MVYFAQEEAKKDLMDQEEKGTTVEDRSEERDELCKLSAALAVLASASVSPFLSLFDLLRSLRWFFSGMNCKLCLYPLTVFLLMFSDKSKCILPVLFGISNLGCRDSYMWFLCEGE
jgi:hypothetical protein